MAYFYPSANGEHVMSKFFHYSQNNSGGSFVFDKEKGITNNVVIEAESADAANVRAELIGLYFNGCEDGKDCECCGDRWNSQYRDEDGDEKPTVYGEPLGKKQKVTMAWMEDGCETVVHYADGRIEWYGADGTKTEQT